VSLDPADTAPVEATGRRHRRRWVIAGVGAILAVVTALAVAVFEVQTLFIDERAAEAPPVFRSGAAESAPVHPAPLAPAPTTSASTTVSSPLASANAPTTSVPTTTTAQVVRVDVQGQFISREHDTSGHASILTDGSQRFLRLTDFSTSNGPDVHVYLTAGVTANGPQSAFDDDFVELGGLKGNVGDQNYEVPADADARYRTVVIWCDRFNVVFGAADLA
jgi:hypothetical protein